MTSGSAVGLAALLAGAGMTHFLRPRPYDAIIPSRLPGRPRTWTYVSGLVELGCAAAILTRRTRRAGALTAAGLFVGVFPGNVKMAYDWRGRALPYRTAAYARLPLQVPLVAWALSVARSR
jgi:uncharacterized membrane protein